MKKQQRKKPVAKPKRRSSKSVRLNRLLLYWAIAITVVVLVWGGIALNNFVYRYKKNIPAKCTIYIKPGLSYEGMLDTLKGKVKSLRSFKKVAEKEHFKENIKPGRYVFAKGTTNLGIVRTIKFGKQTPLMVSIAGVIRSKERLAQKLSARLCADSAAFMNAFTDSVLLADLQIDTNALLATFLPDSYQMFWTTSPEGVLKRMKKEYDIFWNEDRLKKAKALNLSPLQVSILASILVGESHYEPEYPKIASVYLNRLKKGWKLCADPTVIYAIGDFSIRRVLKSHLQVDSPFNTYKYAGLPPAPIAVPTKEAIEGVLNAEKTNYLYFCANAALNGTHNFAVSGSDHLKNARAYQKAVANRQKAKI